MQGSLRVTNTSYTSLLNVASSTYLKGHLYLTGTATQVANTTTQICFSNADGSNKFICLSSNQTPILSVRAGDSDTGQILLRPNGITQFTYSGQATGSTSTNSGALYIAGGMGVAKSVYIGDALNVATSTSLSGHLYLLGVTDSSTTNTTQIIFKASGTETIAVSSATNNTLIINPTSSTTTGQIILKPSGVSQFTQSSQATGSTSSTAGALYVAGGMGVAKNVYIGGSILPTSTTSYLGGTDNPWTALFLNGAINFYHTYLIKGSVPDTNTDSWIGYQYAYDSSGHEQANRLFVQETQIDTAGSLIHYLRAYAYKNNSTDQLYLALKITNDETPARTIITNGQINSGTITVNGTIFAGNPNDTVEHQVYARSSAGDIYLYSQGSATGKRGIYLASRVVNGVTYNSKAVFTVDQYNNITYNSGTINGQLTGNITLPDGGRLGKVSGNMYIGDSGNSGWVLTQDICSHTAAGDSYWSARANGTGHFKTVYGAVWNDYAEMRNVPQAQIDINRIHDNKGEIERDYPYAGYCVQENGDGTMKLVSQRLAKGCKIISDTFGFCIGETKECCTPIAVTGRVLAYPYEDINEFKNHIGDCVCSGPNGTISIMTQEEKIQYPECIIGTISEIPSYDIWYCGNKTTKPIDINGRIWIYVR